MYRLRVDKYIYSKHQQITTPELKLHLDTIFNNFDTKA